MSNLHLFFSVNEEMQIKKKIEMGRKKPNVEQGILCAEGTRDLLPATKNKNNAARCSGDITNRSDATAAVYRMMK